MISGLVIDSMSPSQLVHQKMNLFFSLFHTNYRIAFITNTFCVPESKTNRFKKRSAILISHNIWYHHLNTFLPRWKALMLPLHRGGSRNLIQNRVAQSSLSNF